MLLRTLFGDRVIAPRAVELELRKAMRHGWAPAAQALIGQHGILRIVSLTADQVERGNRLANELPVKDGQLWENRGEAHAIVLARDLQTQGRSALVIDERDGSTAAIGQGINTLASVYVLMYAAVQAVLADGESWRVYVDLVERTGMGIPAEGWRPTAANEQWFHATLVSWRARVQATP